MSETKLTFCKISKLKNKKLPYTKTWENVLNYFNEILPSFSGWVSSSACGLESTTTVLVGGLWTEDIPFTRSAQLFPGDFAGILKLGIQNCLYYLRKT